MRFTLTYILLFNHIFRQRKISNVPSHVEGIKCSR